jgi:hypothetical protein
MCRVRRLTCEHFGRAETQEYVSRLQSAVQRWSHDLFTCNDRPRARRMMPDGLPAYPRPKEHSTWLASVTAGHGVQQCTVTMHFDTPSGADPLLRELQGDGAAVQRNAPKVHLRWLSADWWCANPDLLALVPHMHDSASTGGDCVPHPATNGTGAPPVRQSTV